MLCTVVGFHGCHPEKRNNQVLLVIGAVGFRRDQPLGNLQGLLVVLTRRVPLAQSLE
jgi:thiamine pyrophosphokinase